MKLIKKELRFSVEKSFGNLYRKQCVLVAVESDNGNILIGSKPSFYPPGISRLLGGGVEEGETVIDGLVREVSEELGLELDKSLFEPLALFDVYAKNSEDEEFHNQTYVYHVKLGKQKYKAGGDVKHILEVTIDQLAELGKSYENLSETLWYKGNEGTFGWKDYAKMYGPIHSITASLLSSKKLPS